MKAKLTSRKRRRKATRGASGRKERRKKDEMRRRVARTRREMRSPRCRFACLSPAARVLLPCIASSSHHRLAARQRQKALASPILFGRLL